MVLLALVPPLFRRVMHARLPTAAGSETAAQPEKLAARA
jgi:hypothetical protein